MRLEFTCGIVLMASLWSCVVARASEGPSQLEVEPFALLPSDVRQPEGLTVDPSSGEVFVGTFDARDPKHLRNNVLLRYSVDGELLGSAKFGETPLTGIEYRDGYIYVLNFGASKLQRVRADFTGNPKVEDRVTFHALAPSAPTARRINNPDGSDDSIVFGSNGLPGPNGMVFDRKGNLFISDSFQGAIYRVANATRCDPCSLEVISRDSLLGTAGPLPFGANGLAFNADETLLYITNAGDGRLLRMNLATAKIDILAESLPGADGLMFHDGLLWVNANQVDTVVGVDEAGLIRFRVGAFNSLTEDGAPIGLLFPASAAVGQDDWIFVSNLALALTPTVGDEWEEKVRRWTIVRFKAPKVMK